MLKTRSINSNIEEDGKIPAHLLGNVWGQIWNNLFDFAVPYQEAGAINVTKSLIDKVSS